MFELPSSGWAKKGFFGNILKQHKSLASNVLCRCTRRFEHFDICCTSIVQLAMIFVTTNNFTFRTPNLLQRRLAWFIWFLHLPRAWLRVWSLLSLSSRYSSSSYQGCVWGHFVCDRFIKEKLKSIYVRKFRLDVLISGIKTVVNLTSHETDQSSEIIPIDNVLYNSDQAIYYNNHI